MKPGMNQVLSDCMGERQKFQDRPDPGQRPQTHWLEVRAQTPHRNKGQIPSSNEYMQDVAVKATTTMSFVLFGSGVKYAPMPIRFYRFPL